VCHVLDPHKFRIIKDCWKKTDKSFSMMRCMLLSGQPYRWVEPRLYGQKLRNYQREIKKDLNQRVA
jgi:hypothetical protein